MTKQMIDMLEGALYVAAEEKWHNLKPICKETNKDEFVEYTIEQWMETAKSKKEK